jgi:hypothetical protein
MAPKNDPTVMYHVAAQFLMAAYRRSRREPFSGRAPEALRIPAIINVAFAAEVLLKGILRAEGIEPPRDHKLAGLFALLPEHHRDGILTRVSNEFDLFDERLASVSTAFEEWRYVYEKEALVIESHRFLHRFTNTAADRLAQQCKLAQATPLSRVACACGRGTELSRWLIPRVDRCAARAGHNDRGS